MQAGGAVAQLGERDVRNVEVRGSIPLRSTTRFAVNRQPQFGVARVARFRQNRPPRPSYPRPRDAAVPNFLRNPPTVSAGGFSDPSFADVVTGFVPVYRPNPSSLR